MKERDVVYQEAVGRITRSDQLRARMGPVTCAPPMSQSVSSQVINGRSTKQVTLIVPVYGQSGQAAQAQVRSSDADGSTEC